MNVRDQTHAPRSAEFWLSGSVYVSSVPNLQPSTWYTINTLSVMKRVARRVLSSLGVAIILQTTDYLHSIIVCYIQCHHIYVHVGLSMVITAKAAPVTGTILRAIGPVLADSRQ